MAEPLQRIDITRQRLRSTAFADIAAGLRVWGQVGSSSISTNLRAIIDAVDLTEHELLDKINLALDRIIEHLEEITGEEFTIEDVIEWL